MILLSAIFLHPCTHTNTLGENKQETLPVTEPIPESKWFHSTYTTAVQWRVPPYILVFISILTLHQLVFIKYFLCLEKLAMNIHILNDEGRKARNQ